MTNPIEPLIKEGIINNCKAPEEALKEYMISNVGLYDAFISWSMGDELNYTKEYIGEALIALHELAYLLDIDVNSAIEDEMQERF